MRPSQRLKTSDKRAVKNIRLGRVENGTIRFKTRIGSSQPGFIWGNDQGAPLVKNGSRLPPDVGELIANGTLPRTLPGEERRSLVQFRQIGSFRNKCESIQNRLILVR